MVKGSVGEVTRRRSGRISALEEEKRKKAQTSGNDNVSENQSHIARGTSTSRRGHKRKRLDDVCLSSPQNREYLEDEDYSIYDDEAANLSFIHEDPETRILEYIFDRLERRDTSNLFAKPVVHQEVWTYYKIIKEPMDFRTMREKIQAGSYKSLEKFEYDVNLISTNAMHFNAPTTFFYQEAQAIQELAQQLFHSLRHDPEEFQLQSVMYKRDPDRSSHKQVPRPIGRPSSLRHPYVRRNSQAGLLNANSSRTRIGENLTERRQTYWLSDEDKSLLSVVLDSAKVLCYKGNGDFGYKESLMRFAEKLGPTARRIAESKLAQPFGQSLNPQPQTAPQVQIQNLRENALPVLALPASEPPSHLPYGNTRQMHRPSLSDSNASLHGDVSAQGNARNNSFSIHVNDRGSRRNMNPPRASQLDNVPNSQDKGNMMVDTEPRSYLQNLNNNVRLQSHIRVARDYSSSGTSSGGMNFRAVDMLGKPYPLENQQHLQLSYQLPGRSAVPNSGILSGAVNAVANTSFQENQWLQPAHLSSTGSSNQSSLLDIMAGRSTYLKPSSSSLHSSPAMLSRLGVASTSLQDFASQVNTNNAAKFAECGQLLRSSQYSSEQEMQENCSFLNLLGVNTSTC